MLERTAMVLTTPELLSEWIPLSSLHLYPGKTAEYPVFKYRIHPQNLPTWGQLSKPEGVSIGFVWKTLSRGMELARIYLSKWKVARWLPEALLVLLLWSGRLRRVSWASGHRSTMWLVQEARAFDKRPARSKLSWMKRGFQCVSRILWNDKWHQTRSEFFQK